MRILQSNNKNNKKHNMTKEELKVMIDNTINSNGKRSITGKSLNLALTQIVDCIGEKFNDGEVELKRNDVNFFDYDGTLLYSYTYEEACALTELPPLPVHEGLEVREWNYTLEDIKAQGHLGPWDNYDIYFPVGDFTFEGKTYKAYTYNGESVEDLGFGYLFDGEPSEDNLEYLYICNEDGEWYEDGRWFVNGTILVGKADVGACVYDADGNQVEHPNTYILERDFTGYAPSRIGARLSVISIPNIEIEFLSNTFDNSLIRSLRIPISISYIPAGYHFIQNATIKEFYWNGYGRVYRNFFHNCYVEGFTLNIPNNFAEVDNFPMDIFTSILKFPKTIEFCTINNAYSNNDKYHKYRVFDFTSLKTIPSIDYIPNLGTYFKGAIVVPDELYDDWVNATNWSECATFIYSASEYYGNFNVEEL